MISETLIRAGKDILKGLVRHFTEDEVNGFKNQYSTSDPTITIEEAIDGIEGNLIPFAILHCEDTLKKVNRPYIVSSIMVEVNHSYNTNYGDNKECECGHSYYRHFDTYEKMEPVGCKYCQCYDFKEKIV